MGARRSGVESGVTGVELQPGDHVCAFYRGPEERNRLLRGFLGAGVVSGEKCICVVDTVRPEQVIKLVAARPSQPDQLEVLASTEAYLQGGRFDPGRMIEFWDRALRRTMSRGYRFARAVGEMTWALRNAPGVDLLIQYEAELNRFLPRYPQVILCLYDLECFGGDLVIDLMKTHPKLLIGDVLLENPYYLDPDEFLAQLAAQD